MAGRLSKEQKKQKPQHTDVADMWLSTIGRYFEEYKRRFRMAAVKQNLRFDEDDFQRTILDCYHSISRNNLRDTSDQGCLDYFFKAWKMSTRRISNYDKRKASDIDVDTVTEQYRRNQMNVMQVAKKQLLDDFTITEILSMVERNFDNITYNCFRLKHLTPMTYKALKNLTHVDDCKKRVVSVNKWLKENYSLEENYNKFIEKYKDLEDV